MRAIIVGALILASGAFVGCKWDQGKQQGTQQSGQPAAQPDAPAGTGGGGQSGTSQDRVIPPGSPGAEPRPTEGATGTSPDTGDVQRGAEDTGGGGAVAPKQGPSDEQTRRPRSQPGALAAGPLGMASVSRVQLQQEEASPPEEVVEESPGFEDGTGGSGAATQDPPSQHGGSGLVTEEGAAGDVMEQQEQRSGAEGETQDDTLPHTNPEMQEGIGGSGPVEQGDVDPAPMDEPQFPEEPLFIPPLEALKPFSESLEGTGGSGTAGMTQQAPTAQRNPVIGQVHARNQDQLVVQDVQRDVYALTLEPNACISRDGKAISLSQLDAGDTVRARWSMREGKRVATWVDVLRDSQPSQQQGTGGSGLDDGSGAQGEEPVPEPLGNDEFQGH